MLVAAAASRQPVYGSDMDNTSPKVRSAVMGRIRSRHTKPEIAVRRYLHGAGHRFRLHRTDLPGKPDLVFPARKVAVFVHGCFWHQHGCRLSHVPASRQDYWEPKLAGNSQRDDIACRALERLGWRVLVIWECETRDLSRLQHLSATIRSISPQVSL